jgi:Eukaryotic aspartyl protease
LDFDTGSSDLWCWSTQLPQDILSAASAHNIFDPTKSSTFQNTDGSTWNITYGDGSGASGSVGTDNVTIGGLTIENQAIELASQLSQQFTQDSSDGLLGLAWPTINTVTPTPVATPVENMISQQDIPASQELFTAYLGSWRDSNQADKGESWYTFGHIDQDAVAASGKDIVYTDVDNSSGFWMFNSPTGTVNGTSFDIGNAIADTGTTLMLVPDAACQAIYAAIPGAQYDAQQQGWLYPISTTVDQLPVVTVSFGGVQFAIRKEDLGFSEPTPGMYYGGIQSAGNQPVSIFGDTFLKSVYMVSFVSTI